MNAPAPAPLADRLGRSVRYLRVSVTDRCDMRCAYCMPLGPRPVAGREDVLTFEEIERVVRILSTRGVRGVRLTGGEPLVRRGIQALVARLAAVPGLEEVTLTTNGRLLGCSVDALRDAGLTRVNISLDSLDRQTFARLTGGDHLPAVLAGLAAACAAGFSVVKVNTVVVRGVNEDEVGAIVRTCRRLGAIPRFIELMPALGARDASRVVTAEEVRASLVRAGLELSTDEPTDVLGRGPARYRSIRDGRGSAWSPVGFIPPLSDAFCATCNRVRITSTGELRPCLGWTEGPSLRTLLRDGASDAGVLDAIEAALLAKRDGHGFCQADAVCLDSSMSALGG